jgi:uncharacterized membrane protein YfcA
MLSARLLGVVISALIAGMMNSIAGGGTLVTFPALVALGVPPLNANATSTVALWPASLSSMWGYRDQLRGSRVWAWGFAIPSLVGGGIGAWLLLRTPAARFAALVPWLVLGATALFIVQRPALSWVRRRRATPDGRPDDVATRFPSIGIMLFQLLVAIYGGYFGAGIGILMLAALGMMGFSNIHQMNGLKNWGGLCINAVAALMFAFTRLVSWPVALAMAVGSVSGGYLGARAAQRVPQSLVRGAVVTIGLISSVMLFAFR